MPRIGNYLIRCGLEYWRALLPIMAVDADIENTVRAALENAPEPRQLRKWCEKHADLGIVRPKMCLCSITLTNSFS